jgi:formylglycine-generating enzyme required for sulfatase activity
MSRAHGARAIKELRPVRAVVAALALAVVPAGGATAASESGAKTHIPHLIRIPAGDFIAGSSRAERERAYGLDEAAYGHSVTRRDRWYENEPARLLRHTGAYAITATPVTNGQYAAFISATGHPPPDVGAATWKSYGLIHPYKSTRRHAWVAGRPPKGRGRHPVVLVSHADAQAYAGWLTRVTGKRWRLPTEDEWEKAVRGPKGAMFPWGGAFDARRLNSHDRGPFDTMEVGRFPQGAGPYGLLDGAGQVFEWTASPVGRARFIVKGGSWDDKGCGVCRPAARHGRPAKLRHILIGFRLMREE